MQNDMTDAANPAKAQQRRVQYGSTAGKAPPAG